MDARLKRIKELFFESEKRNGELAHENFELKKRIAELEGIDIVHCNECIHEDCGMCSHIDHEWERHEADYFCADGERKE